MSVSGLSHINLRLSQPTLDRLVDFYVNLLGLSVGERPPFRSSGFWLYAGERPIVHLVEAPAEEGATRHRSEVVDHLAFSCADYDGTLARLEAAGIECDRRQVPDRPMRQLFFQDPAGVEIELIFDEP